MQSIEETKQKIKVLVDRRCECLLSIRGDYICTRCFNLMWECKTLAALEQKLCD